MLAQPNAGSNGIVPFRIQRGDVRHRETKNESAKILAIPVEDFRHDDFTQVRKLVAVRRGYVADSLLLDLTQHFTGRR